MNTSRKLVTRILFRKSIPQIKHSKSYSDCTRCCYRAMEVIKFTFIPCLIGCFIGLIINDWWRSKKKVVKKTILDENQSTNDE